VVPSGSVTLIFSPAIFIPTFSLLPFWQYLIVVFLLVSLPALSHQLCHFASCLILAWVIL
jgi:hypothetical protein